MTPFRPSEALQAVIDLSVSLSRQRGFQFVTVETFARAMEELHPAVADETTLASRLYHRVGRTNQLLAALNHTMSSLTTATQANTQEERSLVATLDDLTAVVQQLSADDSALKTSVDAVVQALADAKAGGFTPEQQAALDSAVTGLSQVHTDLQADAQEAADAANPPPPPAPQG